MSTKLLNNKLTTKIFIIIILSLCTLTYFTFKTISEDLYKFRTTEKNLLINKILQNIYIKPNHTITVNQKHIAKTLYEYKNATNEDLKNIFDITHKLLIDQELTLINFELYTDQILKIVGTNDRTQYIFILNRYINEMIIKPDFILDRNKQDIIKSAGLIESEKYQTSVMTLMIDIIIIGLLYTSLLFYGVSQLVYINKMFKELENKLEYIINNNNRYLKIEEPDNDDEFSKIIELFNKFIDIKESDFKKDLFIIEEIQNIVEKIDDGVYSFTIDEHSNNVHIETLSKVINKMITKTMKQLVSINDYIIDIYKNKNNENIKSKDFSGIFGSIFLSIQTLKLYYSNLFIYSNKLNNDVDVIEEYNNLSKDDEGYKFINELFNLIGDMIQEKNSLINNNSVKTVNINNITHIESPIKKWIIESELHNKSYIKYPEWEEINRINKDIYKHIREYYELNNNNISTVRMEYKIEEIEADYQKLISLIDILSRKYIVEINYLNI